MDAWEGSQLNKAKEILAFELTKLVHGEDEANKAQEAAKALFSAGTDSADMPTTVITAEDFEDGKIGIIKLLVKAGLAKSNGDARKLIAGGGVSVDEEKLSGNDLFYAVDESRFDDGGYVIIRKGKKSFNKITK